MNDALLIRQSGTPSGSFGTRPEHRTLSELKEFCAVVIDKPSGPTSHQVAAYTQEILEVDKAGHGGTLDPKVTGVLAIATNRAARLLEYQLSAGKTYVCVMHLHDDIPEDRILAAAREFEGVITQLPPKRSAVARKHRKRSIYSFKVQEIRGRDVLFTTDVQAGTYIRKLCHDFGLHLNSGAHMAELRRTRAARFSEEQAVSLQTLSDAYAAAKNGEESLFRSIVMPGERLTEHFPTIVILDSAVHSLTQGALLKVPGISAVSPKIKPGDTVRIMTLKGELVAMATARLSSNQLLSKQSGIAAKSDKVFLGQDVYPRME